jgi:hypothetical protein
MAIVQPGGMNGFNRSSNGMSYILVMTFVQIIMDSGGPAYRLIDQAIYLSFTTRALLMHDAKGLALAEQERDELFKLQLEYQSTYDDEEFKHAGQKDYKQMVMLSVQNLFALACQYDLINPSLLAEVQGTSWKNFAKAET